MCILRGTQISLCVLNSLFILFLTPNCSLSHPKNPQEFRAVPLHFKPVSIKYASEIHHLPSNSHHIHWLFSLKLPIVLGWEYRDASLKKKKLSKSTQHSGTFTLTSLWFLKQRQWQIFQTSDSVSLAIISKWRLGCTARSSDTTLKNIQEVKTQSKRGSRE